MNDERDQEDNRRHADEPVGDGHPPSKEDLLKTTAVAVVIAVAALIFFVLPAEYGIDPTGFGQAIGLMDEGGAAGVDAVNIQPGPARNQTLVVDLPPSGAWREVKFDMQAGMTLVWDWQADFLVQYDLHSDEAGSYDAGEATARSGSFTAPDDGAYGWAFRTPSADATTLTLRVVGHWMDG